MATKQQTGGIAPSRPPRAGRSVQPVYEDFSPISEWKQQEQSQLLLVHLPGFVKEQIKVSTEGTNTLRVLGERLVGGNKWSRFQEEYHIPEECNIRGIRANFGDGTLTIIMPNKRSVLPQVSPTKEAAKTTNHQASPPLGDQLPPKTISTASEAKRTDGKGIIEEPSSQKVATEPPKSPKGQGKTPPKPASGMDSVKQPAEGKGTVGSTSATKITPETTERKQRGQGKENLVEVKTPENIALDKTVQKEEEISGKGKVSLKTENLIKKTVKEAKEESEGTAGVHKVNTADLSDVAKEKLKADDVTCAGVAAAAAADDDDDEGSKLLKYKQALKGIIAKGGNLNEERQLIVNMGVAILVIVAVGAYVSYKLGSSGKTEH